MELSLLLAKVIGISLMVISLALLVNKKGIDLLFSLYSRTEVVFITGIVEVFLGLLLIINHNIWTFDFRVIITIVGWILLLRGLGRTFFPGRVPVMLRKFRKMIWIFTPLLIFIFLVGAYLAYSGLTG